MGNDIGGIDSGFLVKSSRVTAIDVDTGRADDAVHAAGWNARSSQRVRPPLVLFARSSHQTVDDAGLPVTVIVNHLRSLSSFNSWDRRRAGAGQAQGAGRVLANLIQTRQDGEPSELIVSVGDYNAFQFSDGYRRCDRYESKGRPHRRSW
jgi:predicted extracellular nuclease